MRVYSKKKEIHRAIENHKEATAQFPGLCDTKTGSGNISLTGRKPGSRARGRPRIKCVYDFKENVPSSLSALKIL